MGQNTSKPHQVVTSLPKGWFIESTPLPSGVNDTLTPKDSRISH
ncbi:hypothetical protein [uncultured Helicobacter sp.]